MDYGSCLSTCLLQLFQLRDLASHINRISLIPLNGKYTYGSKSLIKLTVQYVLPRIHCELQSLKLGGCFRECSIVQPYYRMRCDRLEQFQTEIDNQNFCGIYNVTENLFADCRTNEAELSALFYEMCLYDYCGNVLTSDLEELSGSGCIVQDCMYQSCV